MTRNACLYRRTPLVLTMMCLIAVLRARRTRTRRYRRVIVRRVVTRTVYRHGLQLPNVLVCVNVRRLPIKLLLRSTVVNSAVRMELVNETNVRLLTYLLRFLVANEDRVHTVPIRQFVCRRSATIRLNTSNGAPVMRGIQRPMFAYLSGLPTRRRNVSNGSTRRRHLRTMLEVRGVHVLPINAARVNEGASVVVTSNDRLLLCLN